MEKKQLINNTRKAAYCCRSL
uniref:Uncharacterized protein n=1 Tax=Anguilla anguilla TaxID=7936 RepID=A0A0E9V798_ANGAN